MPPTLDSMPPAQKLLAMKAVAKLKVDKANGSEAFFAEIEDHIDLIAIAGLGKMAPVNENLLGYVLMLMAEIKRLRT